ncbi:MAG: hypothetical protein ACREVK_11650 [Gammaproteobacteria bacterium]
MLTCAGALLAFCGAAPVHAVGGNPDTGDVSFFGNPVALDESGKFYCDWRFKPPLAACALDGPNAVPVQVDPGFQPGLEADTTISSTSFASITTSTESTSSVRVTHICETVVDGTEACLTITEDPDDGGGVASCPAKFASITRNMAQCADNLAALQPAYGTGARLDLTLDRDLAGGVIVNICTPANWICEDHPSSLTLLGKREIQQIPMAVVETPLLCKSGTFWYNDPKPPCP